MNAGWEMETLSVFKINAALLLLSLTSSAAAQTGSEHIMFTKYAAQHQAVPAQPPQAIVPPKDMMFRTRLRRITEGKPNFADHSRIELWGCGTDCFMFGIANLRTGSTYLFPQSVAFGHRLLFDRHSNALHVVGMFDEKFPADRWYLWNEQSLTDIRNVRLPEHCFNPPEDAESLLPTAECNFQPTEERIGPQHEDITSR